MKYMINIKKEKRFLNFFIMCNVFLYEFYRGFRMMRTAAPCITVFGSARVPEHDPYYKQTYGIGQMIASLGYTTVTGGGGGLMEAANRGAFEHGGKSIGCNIVLPFEQFPNAYLHDFFTFNYFFIRKFMLTNFSVAYIVAPGGFGTADEFFGVATLLQTQVIEKRPIIFLNSDFHQSLRDYLEKMKKEGLISAHDLDFVYFLDTYEEIHALLKNSIVISPRKHKLPHRRIV